MEKNLKIETLRFKKVDGWFCGLYLDKETSGSQILDFLNSALNRFLDKDDYQVNTEKDRELIDRIIKSTSLSKLKVVVSYSNNDNNKGWKKLIDDQLKRSRPKKAVLDLSGSKKIPIDVTRSEMITGFVELSASNGYVEASEIDEKGAIHPIRTIDHPMVKVVEFIDSPISALKKMIRSIAGFGEKTSE